MAGGFLWLTPRLFPALHIHGTKNLGVIPEALLLYHMCLHCMQCHFLSVRAVLSVQVVVEKKSEVESRHLSFVCQGCCA